MVSPHESRVLARTRPDEGGRRQPPQPAAGIDSTTSRADRRSVPPKSRRHWHFGHESGLAPTQTFYSRPSHQDIVALEISNASQPLLLGTMAVKSHGLASPRTARAYVAKDRGYVAADGDPANSLGI